MQVRGYDGATSVCPMRSAFCEHVLVLAIANDQCPLAGPVSDHKLESHVRRVGGDERDRPVIVLARGHFAFPFSEIERRRASVVEDRKSTRLNSSHLGISYAV